VGGWAPGCPLTSRLPPNRSLFIDC